MLLLGLVPGLHAQLRFTGQVDTYADEATALLASAKLQSADSIVQAFTAGFGSMSAEQKKTIVEMSVTMQKQSMGPVPYFTSFYSLVAAAQSAQLSATQSANLYKTLHKSLYNVRPNVYVKLLNTYRLFLEQKMLFSNKFLRLRVTNDQFDFEYRGGNRVPGDTVGLYAEQNPVYGETPPGPDPVTDSYGNLLPQPPQHPELKGALLVFKQLDLNWATNYDSTFLTATKGTLHLETDKFYGEGGKFDWSVTGLDPTETYATLGTYVFLTTTAKLFAEVATLKASKITDKDVPGRFEFQSTQHATPELAKYPKFQSYFSDYTLRNTPSNISAKGGVSLEGKYHNTSCIFETPTAIKVLYKGAVVYRGLGARFEFGDSLVKSPEAASTFYWKGDSLTQPGSAFYFYTNQNIIRLITKRSRFEGAPYRDTYHQVEITTDEAKVRLDSAKIEYYITIANNRVPTIFESADFFSEDRVVASQGLSNYNLMLILMTIYVKNKNNVIHVSELPDVVTRNRPNMYSNIQVLVKSGYVGFDKRTDQITLYDKIKHYYTSQRKLKDYDNIQIRSVSPVKPNAIQDLEKREVLMNGVERFTISDSLGVFVIPKDQEMKLVKNRDVLFDGMISAGVFMTHGKNFKFEYDKFKVDLAEIDSIGIKLPDVLDSTSGKMRAASPVKLENKRHGAQRDSMMAEAKEKIKSVKTHGTLFINLPDNKSGKKKLPQYPIFDVVDFSYVYFDAKHILGGAYNQDVYFTVPPFNIDSTASTNLQAISFKGDFHSDNIFPDFKEELRVQPDRSLGFEHKVPVTGYKLYGGNAVFNGTVSLNNKGIRGKGEIKYLTSTIKSDDFIFYQDSVVAKGNTFVLREANDAMGNFPDAVAAGFTMKWLPKKDSLIVRNDPDKGPFRMYKGTSTLDGQLVLSSGGVVKGGGVVKRAGSQVRSNDMTFAIDNFKGREANFEIESSTEGKPAMRSTNVKFKYDMVAKKAEFETEVSGFASNEFPYTQFKTSIPKATWDFEKSIITMSKPDSTELANSIFYSTLPELDSVNFQAKEAVYDLKNYSLKISGVPFIHVGDAELLPDSGQVEILENAEITPLRNATVIVDSLNRYHKLVKGEIVVKNRHKFEGTATYRYGVSEGDTLDINFSQFSQERLDPKAKKGPKVKQVFTTGIGKVPEDDPLRIIPGVIFRGDVKMIASKKYLEFDGEIALDLKGNADKSWVKFKKTSDDNNFAVNLKGATNASGQAVVTGVYYDSDGRIYSLFVDSKRSPNDAELFSASGTLKPNAETREFSVGKVEKLDPAKKVYEGNVFSYSDTTKTDSFDGEFTFTSPAEKNFQIYAAGAGVGKRASGEMNLRLTMALDFTLTENAFKLMAADLQDRKKNAGIGPVSVPIDSLLPRIGDLAGQKAAEDYRKRYGSYLPLTAVGGKLAKGIVLSDVVLNWSQKENAWYSTGPIGLGNVGKFDINASVEGYLEIKKTESGQDVVKLFIQPTPDAFYFFTYSNKRLLSIGTNNPYDAELATKGKGNKGASNQYNFGLVDDADRIDFVKAFNKTYLGRDVELTPFVPQIGTVAATSSATEDTTSQVVGGIDESATQTQDGVSADSTTKPTAKVEVPINPLTGLPDSSLIGSTPTPDAAATAKETKKETKADNKKKKKEKEAEKPKEETVPETIAPAQEVDPLTGQPLTPEAKPEEKKAEEPKAEEKKAEEKKAEEKPAEAPKQEVDPLTGQPLTPEAKPEEKKAEEKPVEAPKQEVDPLTGQPLTPVVDSVLIKKRIDSVAKAKSDSVLKAKADSTAKAQEQLKKQEQDQLKKAEEAKKEAERKAQEEADRKKKEEEEKKKAEEKKEEPAPADEPPLLPPPSDNPLPADSTQKPPPK